jgi:hypothetical protein
MTNESAPALLDQPGAWHTETEFRMQLNDISRAETGGGGWPVEPDDAAWQRAILGLLFEQCPQHLTKAELALEILGENPGFAARDALERGLEALTNAGLVQGNGRLILLTRAARYYRELEE